MKRALLITIVLLALLPDVVKAQWTFDVVSVEAYINDHKKQRSLLLARSTLEYSNQLLHEYSRKEVGEYKELNIDLDRYTRAFDVIDVMYQSLRTVLNAKNTYNTVSDRIADYKSMLEAFHEKVLKRGRIEPSDALLITINEKAIRDIAHDGERALHRRLRPRKRSSVSSSRRGRWHRDKCSPGRPARRKYCGGHRGCG